MAYDPNVLRRASARLEEEKRRREDERELLMLFRGADGQAQAQMLQLCQGVSKG